MLEDIFFNQMRLRDTTLNEISGFVLDRPKNSFGEHFHFLAASSIVAAADSQELNEIFSSGVSLCDSAPLGAVLRITNSSFQNIRGSDFIRELIRRDDGSFRHFFLIPETTVYDSFVEFCKGLNPRIRLVGSIVPPYANDFKEDYPEWERRILQSNADIVWVGLGSPKQDFIVNHLSKSTGKTCIAVGAALEFVSGVKTEAPRFVQLLYLEWLFRLLQDPRRLFSRYTIGNTKFLIEVTKHLVSLRRIR
jgi:N-acetylglucosaminyldiphosphoundecaprenol N-acetyl-beta-D-mannosaminyltransferase